MTQTPRRPHPAPEAEMTLRDLEENQGWHVTWNEAEDLFVVECPHGQAPYKWPRHP